LVLPPADLHAFPDGLRPSPSHESIIVAFYDAAPVDTGTAKEIRIADGAILNEWLLPGSPRVTCPEFVRIDGKVKLIFTTADEGMPAEARALAPEAGTIFLGETPFDALPEPPPLFPH
jgi:sugar lactone lactonase YvrE